MSKKRKRFNYKYGVLLFLASALIFGIGGYYLGSRGHNAYRDPSGNQSGYVNAQPAKEQVYNFYRQYIEDNNKPELRPFLLRGYGSNNLVFYSTYYRHGFNPITCSSLAPTAVTVTRATPGTVATAYVELEYSDQSTSTIKATVLINNEGIRVDSITCPGDKGNLPPPQV
jgi:hypothetical protein